MVHSEPTKDDISLGEVSFSGSPGSMEERWGEIMVQVHNSNIIHVKYMELIPINWVVTSNSFEHGSKNCQCMAFIATKERQCVGWANDSDVYYYVHLASLFASNSIKKEASSYVD